MRINGDRAAVHELSNSSLHAGPVCNSRRAMVNECTIHACSMTYVWTRTAKCNCSNSLRLPPAGAHVQNRLCSLTGRCEFPATLVLECCRGAKELLFLCTVDKEEGAGLSSVSLARANLRALWVTPASSCVRLFAHEVLSRFHRSPSPTHVLAHPCGSREPKRGNDHRSAQGHGAP